MSTMKPLGLINRLKFCNIVKIASTIVNKKSPKILLTCIQITLKKNKIIIRASNEVVLLSIEREIACELELIFLVNCHKLLSILKKIKGENISIAINKNNKIIISNQDNSDLFELTLLVDDYFTKFPKNQEKALGSINQDKLKQLVSRVAINVDPSSGGRVLMCCKDNQLGLIVHDRVRISRNFIEWKASSFQCDLHLLSCVHLQKTLEGESIEIYYSICNNYLGFHTEQMSLWIRKYEYSNLNYKKFAAKGDGIAVDRDEFSHGFEKMHITTSEMNNAVSLDLNSHNNTLKLNSFNPVAGTKGTTTIKTTDTIPFSHSSSFNAKYLLEAIKCIPHKEKIMVHVEQGSNKPIIIKYKTTIHILMPIFVQAANKR